MNLTISRKGLILVSIPLLFQLLFILLVARLQQRNAQAKARIISEAETLFNKQGFDGASMRDIAAAAEMQPASVYYYFESKEELLWAVWEKGGVELLDRVRNAIADKTDPW